MQKITKRIIASTTWSTTADMTPIDLPREGLITEVTIRFNNTATLTATALDDWFRRGLTNIKILGDGGRAFLGMSGFQMSTMLSLWQEAYLGCPTLHSNGAGIALASPDVGSATSVSVFKWHPGSNPNDPFDLTAAIPAKALSTLQILLTTAIGSVVDPNGLTTAGTINYEICEVLPDNGVPANLMVPTGSTLQYTHTATYSDFSYEIDIPAGAWLRSIICRFTDHTAAPAQRRTDTTVTGVRIRLPKTGQLVLEQNIYELKQAMASRFDFRGCAGEVGPLGAIATTRPAPGALLNIVPSGFAIIDLRPYGNPLYGLDLRNYQTGDFKLGLTIGAYGAGDFSTFYWDQLIPVDPQLVGR